MSPALTTWRVIQAQQDLARKNARQALLVIQQRRREQLEIENVLPLPTDREQRRERPRS